MKKYVIVASTVFTTLGLMRYMNLFPFGNVEGFLILGTLHVSYYLAILEMGPQMVKKSGTHVIRQPRKESLPNKLSVPPVGTVVTNEVRSDVLKALQQLGHSRKNSHELIDVIQKRYPNLKTPNDIVKYCIKESYQK
jgi:hypothetical protein